MTPALLPRHSSLAEASRLPIPVNALSEAASLSQIALLLLCGAASTAAVSWLDFSLKIPGHAILRAIFPMALGLAAVPRRGAGTVMSAGAMGTAAVLQWGGWTGSGVGSLTSLCLIGVFLDLALRTCRSGRRVYFALITAGVLTNLAAMFVQVAAKSFGWRVSGLGKSLGEWLPRALVTYPLCGAIAGLISAVVWFRWISSPAPGPADDLP